VSEIEITIDELRQYSETIPEKDVGWVCQDEIENQSHLNAIHNEILLSKGH
jgi:hypothetical protein